MKKLLSVSICMALVVGLCGAVVAETKTSITGQLRLRDEIDKRQFDTLNSHAQSYSDLRARVQLEAIVDDNAHAVVQFQDSRRLGGQNSFGQNVSGTTNDDEGVGVHQAYVQVDRVAVDGLGVKAGRFEYNMGNERVFGAVGWNNVGRSWEGGMVWFDHEQFVATAFGFKAVERNNAVENQDFDVFGGKFSVKSFNWDLFAFFEYDADTANLFYGINRLERLNIGTYYQRQYQNFDFTGNFVFQTGKVPAGELPLSMNKLDIAAFMFTAEGGYSLQGSANARLALGVDYSSGDDDPADSNFNTYVNAYYTGHKFRGYMDYFVDSETPGLVDIMLRGKFDPHPMWTVSADIHLFQTAKGYTDFMSESTKDVGSEVDVTVSTTVVKGITFSGGGSVFMPKESFAGFADPDPGYWFYSMTTLDF